MTKRKTQLEILLEHQDKAIGLGIEKHVNGHMREMKIEVQATNKKLDQHIEDYRKWTAGAEKYREENDKYKEEKLQPLVITTDRFAWLGKGLKTTASLVVLASATVGALIYLANKIK